MRVAKSKFRALRQDNDFLKNPSVDINLIDSKLANIGV